MAAIRNRRLVCTSTIPTTDLIKNMIKGRRPWATHATTSESSSGYLYLSRWQIWHFLRDIERNVSDADGFLKWEFRTASENWLELERKSEVKSEQVWTGWAGLDITRPFPNLLVQTDEPRAQYWISGIIGRIPVCLFASSYRQSRIIWHKRTAFQSVEHNTCAMIY